MCGICGYYGIKDSSTIKLMTKLLTHRGPDAFGHFSDNLVSLGHRRLSIIDLSTKGKQPMANEDSSIHVTYNGEIYNFPELREDLESKGHKFKSNTDTEVIIHAYEEYGKECLQKLNGMFAFCIYDSNKKELFLARDRLGQKPLYYYYKDGKFIFASELKSILATNFFERTLDYNSLNTFLSYTYIPHPKTAFKDVYKLPPAHYLIVGKNKFTLDSYWDINFSPENKSESNSTKELYSLLEDSVKKRQISDVPIGAFLSGGLDSSLITALMAKINSNPIKTFTIGFENSSFDETPYAKLVADYYNTDHTEIKVNVDCVKMIPKILRSFDEPYSDLAAIPIYYLCEAASKKVKVILSGDGGDELFGGYKRYRSYQLDKYYYKLPKLIRKNLFSSVVNSLKHKNGRYNLIKYAQKYISTSDLPSEKRHIERMNGLDNDLKQEIYTPNFAQTLNSKNPLENHIPKVKSLDPLSQMQYLDIKSFLCDDVLIKSDKMSMAHSLEMRSPILDHRIAEFSAKLPSNLKIKGKKVKYLLSKTSSSLLPKEILQRKKQGMSMPINDWIKNDLSDILENSISGLAKRNLLDKAKTQKFLEKHLQKRGDFSVPLWAIINLEVFLRMYKDNTTISNKTEGVF